MKKILCGLTLCVLGFSSCKDMLFTVPVDFTAPTNWYQNQSQLDLSLNGVYETLLNTYSTRLGVFFPLGNDLIFSREQNASNQVYFYTHTISNTDVKSAWQQLYKGIDNANMFLENADQASETVGADVVRHMKGEALFLRAYYHMMLTLYWGDVPLKLVSTKGIVDSHTPKTNRAGIFNQVFIDMEEALGMVRPIRDIGFGGRVSQSAVKGILARAYLHAAGLLDKDEYYVEARKWALDLIDDNTHDLNPSFSGIFENYGKDIYDIKESIFEVEALAYSPEASYGYSKAGTWSGYYSFKCDVSAATPIQGMPDVYIGRGRAIFLSTPTFYDMFDEGDLRRDWTIAPRFYSNANPAVPTDFFPEFKHRHMAKFRRLYETPANYYQWSTSANYPLLRYADVLLMFAEADNEVNNGPSADALEAVNKVRRRAFGHAPNTENPGVDKTTMDYAVFKNYIIEERGRELACEGLRKLDLFRWGNLKDRMQLAGERIAAIPKQITDPDSDILINNPAIVQNGTGITQEASVLSQTFKNVYLEPDWQRYLLLPIPIDEISTNINISDNNPGW